MAANVTNPKSPSKTPKSQTAYANFFDSLPTRDRLFIEELQAEFPNFSFKPSHRFRFHPPKTIFLGPPQPYFALQTLHELGHGLCGRWNYKTHVERLNIESRAWQEAKRLCLEHPNWHKKYGVFWDESAENFAEDALDTYRDWLHAKSKCPRCGLTRAQTPEGTYFCPLCDLL